jgi:putative endonuclease
MKNYCVYVMTNTSGTLYIGVTSDLPVRIHQHQNGTYRGFTSRYHITRLVYYETFSVPDDAIAREKQLKRWGRAKKMRLIESMNPGWEDLSASLFDG